jgi:hypothetical protein
MASNITNRAKHEEIGHLRLERRQHPMEKGGEGRAGAGKRKSLVIAVNVCSLARVLL